MNLRSLVASLLVLLGLMACSSSSSKGTVSPGGACTSDGECAGRAGASAVCERVCESNGPISGCQIRTPAKLGESCTGTIVLNSDGTTSTAYSFAYFFDTNMPPPGELSTCAQADALFCDVKSQKCAKLNVPGDACVGSYSCDSTSYCGATQKCIASVAVGGSCQQNDVKACVANAFCDGASGKCAAKLNDGAFCSANSSCASRSCNQSACGPRGLDSVCSGP